MKYLDPLYGDIAIVLSDVFRTVNWRLYTGPKKNSIVSFAERLFIAGHRATVAEALDQLALGFDLGGYVSDPETIYKLQKENDKVLDRMVNESSLLAMYASALSKEWFESHKKEKSA